MEEANRFLNGINTDVHPSAQPADTMRHCLNFVPLSKEGNMYSVTNESGTVVIPEVTFPTGFKVIGKSILNNDIIVTLANDAGHSQVGYIREDASNLHPTYGYYHPVAPFNEGTSTVPENNNELGFTVNHPVDCVSRKLINGHRILYFTDNNVPFGRIDLDNPPVVGNAAESVRLVFDQSIPIISLKDIKENAQGNLRSGIYMFISRYVTENGGYTTFGIPSNPIPVLPTTRSIGVNKYHGEFYESETINKNIVLEFSNVDTKYQELQVIAVWYTGTGVMQAAVAANIPITSEKIEYTFTGDSNEFTSITLEELRETPISYSKAKCVEQKDNRIFFSNLSDSVEDSDTLQEIANNVKVSYEVEEVAYCNRQEEGAVISTGFVKLFGPTINGLNDLVITFNKDLNIATAEVSDFEIKRKGTPAEALVSITDYTLVPGATVALGNANSVGSVTFTAEAAPGTGAANTFIAAVSNNETAANLSNAINNSEDVDNYMAIVDGATVKLVWIGAGAGNGEAITITGSGISASTVTAGGDTTPTTHNASSLTPSGAGITVSFSSLSYITPADELYIGEVASTEGDIYTTGTSSDGTRNYIAILADTGGAEGFTESYASGFTDYINERFTFEKKTYRRGEAYSLGFFLLYKDGTTSFVYHIPGNDKGNIGAISTITGDAIASGKNPSPVADNNTGNSSGLLGTYVSSAEYPLDQSYPGNQAGDDVLVNDFGTTGTFARTDRYVLHHVMPTLAQEPHFRASGNTALIRLLNLKFEFTQQIPADILKNVAEIVFVRERRNTESNKSMYAQGIINRLVETADHFDNDGNVTGSLDNGVKSSYNLMEMPFFNSLRAVVKAVDSNKNGDASAGTQKGICYPGASDEGTSTPSMTDGTMRNTNIRYDRCMFHSPETLLKSNFKPSSDVLVSGKLVPALKLVGTTWKVNEQREYWRGQAGKDWLRHWAYTDMFCDYKSYEMPGVVNTRSVLGAQYVEPAEIRNNAILSDANKPSKTGTRWNQGGLELKLDGNLDEAAGSYLIWNNSAVIWNKASTCVADCTHRADGVSGIYWGVSLGLPDTNQWALLSNLAINQKFDTIRNFLYNLEVANTQQYGELTNAKYIPTARFSPLTSGGAFVTQYSQVYSGDTFITKFAVNTGNLLIKYGYHRSKDSAINKPENKAAETATDSRRDYFHINDDGPEWGNSSPNKAEGCDFRDCSYFFVESEINTYYRHRPQEEEKQDYFPNESNPGTLLSNFYPYFGNIDAYNGLYSYENIIKEYFIKGSTQTVVTKFENRTIYSEQAKEDSVVDSYRIIPVNNYYDLPSNTGPIWDSFIENNTLFLHTPKSLWSTFAEPAATLNANNISDIVLGTGPLFMRPSREVLTTEGGYAGTISQFGGAHTQMGYIFPDLLQGKVFALAYGQQGPFLKELSQEGLTTYFHDNLNLDIIRDATTGRINLGNITTSNAHLIDNPFSGIGCIGGYDYSLKRYFLVKQGMTSLDFTVTFSIITQNWISFHSYVPNVIIPFDNRVFFIRNGATADMWEMNIGDKGNYFGTVYNSEIEVVCATGPSKVFNNIAINSDSTNRTTKVKVRDDNFKSVQVYNDRQNTGIVSLIPGNSFDPLRGDNESFVKFRNSEYRIAIPRDAVVDNGGDVFDAANIYVPQGGTVPIDGDYPYRERIRGDYAQFKYIYDNTPNREFVLKSIRTIFEPNYR